tara:strand:- start:2002 stop:2547 length:546 start_codon:yes stop_codon:yes gene_type:complete
MILKLLTNLKYLAFILLALFSIVIGVFTWDWATGCGSCLQDQDYRFMEKVKSKLKNVGDIVKVADIHDGEWTKVCARSGGYDHNLSWKRNFSGKGGEEIVILNNADPYITDAYDESAMYFHYGQNEQGLEQIEVYQMTPDRMTYQGYIPSKDGCLEKDSAFLQKRSDYYIQLISEKEIDEG